MKMEYAFARMKANDPEGSAMLIGFAKKRFDELKRKDWEWRSFYNGWLEGVAIAVAVVSEDSDPSNDTD